MWVPYRGPLPPGFVPRHRGAFDPVPSAGTKTDRIRALGNRVYVRPPEETFHEFILQVAIWTLGETWWKHQQAMAETEQHVLMRWYKGLAATSRDARPQPGGGFSAPLNAPGQAILLFGYDLYCLQHRYEIPAFMLDRLRRHQSFQSARYEITASGLMVRAGFTIEFLDGNNSQGKHAEIIATHAATGVKVAMEAKSRVRPGTYHQQGCFIYQSDVQGMLKLLKKACKQGDPGLPLIVFIDANVPPLPTTPLQDRPWLRDINLVFDALKRISAEKPTPWTLVVATNIGSNFGDFDTPAPPYEAALLWSDRPRHDLSKELREAILNAVHWYTRLPTEI
jgi:hypothetical protein